MTDPLNALAPPRGNPVQPRIVGLLGRRKPGMRPSYPGASWVIDLTATERRVLRLVAENLTSWEIAVRLGSVPLIH